MRWITVILFIFPSVAICGDWETFPLRRNGGVSAWTIAGSFPNTYSGVHGEGCTGYFKDYLISLGGENNANPAEDDIIALEDGKEVKFRTLFSDSAGIVDFLEAFGVERGIPAEAYAYCRLVSEVKQQVVLQIRSDDGAKVWLNHQMIHDHHVGRSVESAADQISVTLDKGANPLLVKIDQGIGKWGLAVAVHNADGAPAGRLLASIGTQKTLKGKIHQAIFEASPLVIRTRNGDRQIVIADIFSGGLRNFSCRLSHAEWPGPVETRVTDMPPGRFRLQMQIPVIKEATTIKAELKSSTDQLTLPAIAMQRSREWVIYLVQHEHTDIGYTRSQNEMLAENLRYIDYALDYCDLTDGLPDDARFRWTCEVSSPVQEFLMRRPSRQIERLKKRVSEGRIEITGMFLNLSEIATENELAASVQPILDFKLAGLPVRTAMQNDVNGVPWGLVDYLHDSGVKYLSMGINRTRSILPFDRPTAFWWESPSGNRLLAFRADHYHTGNYWLIHEGNMASSETSILKYLESLEKNEYPFDRIAVQFSGTYTDNSPPSIKACELVKTWNETFVWPRLRLATAQEFLNYLAENHRDKLPVYRVAWPDWWTDGFGSGARETAAARKTHWAVQADQMLLAMAALAGTAVSAETNARVRSVQENLLYYDEHTFGADISISDPMSERNLAQWGMKASYAWDAVKNESLLREEALGLLQPYASRAEVPTIAVYNTMNWQRSGLAELFIDHEILPASAVVRLIDGENGEEIPLHLLTSRREGSYWALYAKDVPALGFKTYRMQANQKMQAALPAHSPAPAAELENDFYRLVMDEKKGSIISLFDKAMKMELVDRQCEWSLGQLIREKTRAGRDFGKENFIRSSLKSVSKITGSENGIWKSLYIVADIEGAEEPNGVQIEIRLYNHVKKIELFYDLRKQRYTDGEAWYVAFPFKMPESRIVYEAQGGLVTPGVTQLPGSASDWHTVQSFASVRGREGQVVFSSVQAPLAQFGEINLGKWQKVVQIARPHIYSWVMNNYWFTNFQSIQEGELKWSYALTSDRDTSTVLATQFGWSAAMPLVARAFPPGMNKDGKTALSSIIPGAANVMLVSAKPASDGSGVILHLREVAGKSARLSLSDKMQAGRVKTIEQVNVLEEIIATDIADLSFEPYDVKFIKLVLSEK
jgi:alpha-mannosidase